MLNREILTVLFVVLAVIPARAILISQWTFETSYAGVSGSNPDLGPLSPETGSGSAFGHQATAALPGSSPSISSGLERRSRGFGKTGESPGSFPVGNGSSHSFSINTWAVGDYFEFQLSTAGYQDLRVSWDQTRSSTGPATFDFAYSLSGSSFTIASDNYAVSAIPWSSGRFSSASRFSLDLSAVSALDNISAVYFRLIADSASSSTAGTSRIDDFTVSGAKVPDSSARPRRAPRPAVLSTMSVTKVPDSSPGAAGWACLLALLALASRIPARPAGAKLSESSSGAAGTSSCVGRLRP